MPLRIDEGKDGCAFHVRVQPKSRQDEITGLHGDALKIRLTSPPTGGKANQALRRFLAKRLDVAPSSIEILSGHTSRQMRVRVTGIPAETIRTLLEIK